MLSCNFTGYVTNRNLNFFKRLRARCCNQFLCKVISELTEGDGEFILYQLIKI